MISPEYSSHIQSFLWLLILSGVFILASLLFFEFFKKTVISVILLIITAFTLFSFMAFTDPFIQIWDEQFHGLVAKNLQNHWLKPTLHENPGISIPITTDNYITESHVWVHKQPLFLWQIAASFKLFGVNLYSLRLPTILMLSLLVGIVFRMGQLIKDARTGYYSAFLLLSFSYLLQFSGGRLSTEHNDAAFIFYVTASFWAWFEYRASRKWYWLPIIGILSGFSILVKWLTGLIVYAGWFLFIVLTKSERKNKTNWIHLIISVIITFLVFMPWQIYTYYHFPVETKIAQIVNIQHLQIAVHGKVGDWLFHFDQWGLLVFKYFNWIGLFTILIIPFTKMRRDYKIASLSWIIIVHLFFMFVPTKMNAFTFIVTPIALLLFIYLIIQLFESIDSAALKSYLSISLFVSLFVFFFDFQEIKGKNIYWNHYKTEADHFREIGQMKLPKDSQFFNFYYCGDIRFMFYTPYNAQVILPTEDQILQLKQKNYPIYIFDDGKLPKYIIEDREITKIKAFNWPSYLHQEISFYR